MQATDLILHDQIRGKDLELKVTYPEGADNFPVIVFSHGLLGSKDGYQPLVRYWAEHGYVVIQPTHYDSASFRKPTLTELRDLTPLFVGWESRPDDIILILDELNLIESLLPNFAGKFDHSRIGMGGHSFGSHTSMLIGGAQLSANSFGNCGNASSVSNIGSISNSDKEGTSDGAKATTKTASNSLGKQFRDERPLAFLLLSPQGSGRALTETADFDQSAWDEFERPMMIVTGTEDNGRRRQDYHWRSEAFKLGAPDDKYLMVIEGGYHGFGGITGTKFFGSGPANDSHVEWVQMSTLAFFDRYVKGLPEAARFLTDGELAKVSGGAVQVSYR
ncbi:alpha/beta fold hydrolase [soil metagenome]